MFTTKAYQGIAVQSARPWLRDDMQDFERYIEEPVYRLPLKLLVPWENNPPTRGKEDSRYRVLVQSMEKHGQLVPALILPPEQEVFTVWDGCRRYRAATDKSIGYLDCVVREATSDFLLKVFAANMSQRAWTGHDVGAVIPNYIDPEEVIAAAPENLQRPLRRLVKALTPEEYKEFISVVGPRAAELARRVQRYIAWPDGDRSKILMWIARRTKGNERSARDLEWAIAHKIPAKRIAAAIEGDKGLKLW